MRFFIHLTDQQVNEQAEEQRYKQRQVELEIKRQIIHERREAQRQQMKDKYTLDFDPSKFSPSSRKSSS